MPEIYHPPRAYSSAVVERAQVTRQATSAQSNNTITNKCKIITPKKHSSKRTLPEGSSVSSTYRVTPEPSILQHPPNPKSNDGDKRQTLEENDPELEPHEKKPVKFLKKRFTTIITKIAKGKADADRLLQEFQLKKRQSKQQDLTQKKTSLAPSLIETDCSDTVAKQNSPHFGQEAESPERESIQKQSLRIEGKTTFGKRKEFSSLADSEMTTVRKEKPDSSITKSTENDFFIGTSVLSSMSLGTGVSSLLPPYCDSSLKCHSSSNISDVNVIVVFNASGARETVAAAVSVSCPTESRPTMTPHSKTSGIVPAEAPTLFKSASFSSLASLPSVATIDNCDLSVHTQSPTTLEHWFREGNTLTGCIDFEDNDDHNDVSSMAQNEDTDVMSIEKIVDCMKQSVGNIFRQAVVNASDDQCAVFYEVLSVIVSYISMVRRYLVILGLRRRSVIGNK